MMCRERGALSVVGLHTGALATVAVHGTPLTAVGLHSNMLVTAELRAYTTETNCVKEEYSFIRSMCDSGQLTSGVFAVSVLYDWMEVTHAVMS